MNIKNMTRQHHSNNLIVKIGLYCAILSILSATSCINRKSTPTDSPTVGKIGIAVDKAFEPIVKTTLQTFSSIYYDAIITPHYKYEGEVINDFILDSVKVIVTSRPLTDEQVKFLNDTLIFPETIPYYTDAIAFVVNKENRDTTIKYQEIEGIFKGSFTEWSLLDSESQLGGIRVIFDSNLSGNIRYMKERFEITDTPLPSNFYSLSSDEEVINFVARNRDAIGIINFDYVSDKRSRNQQALLNSVKLVSVSNPDSLGNIYFEPSQGCIIDGSYPFCRQVYFITRETYKGLGSGFIQFATSEQGQRIILKAGLKPATMPGRNVRIRK